MVWPFSLKRHLRLVLQFVEWAASAACHRCSKRQLQRRFRERTLAQSVSGLGTSPAFHPGHGQTLPVYSRWGCETANCFVDRYEFLGYRLLRQGLKPATSIAAIASDTGSFEDDLVDDQAWQDKDNLIASTGLPLLKQPIRAHLAELEQQLGRLAEVNERIASSTIHISRPSNAARKC